MGKYALCLVMLMIVSTTYAQIHFSESIRGEVFFGPKNVYPLHKEICLEYVNYYTKLQTQLQERLENPTILDEHASRIGGDLLELSELINLWKEAVYQLEKFNWKEDACYTTTVMDEALHPLTISHLTPSSNIDVYEFIHPRDTKLARLKWVKKRANNCVSDNPEDCFMWCGLLNEDHYEDKSKDYVTLDNYTDLKGFQLAPGSDRLLRSFEIRLVDQKSPLLDCVYEDKDRFLHIPILNIEEVDCE